MMQVYSRIAVPTYCCVLCTVMELPVTAGMLPVFISIGAPVTAGVSITVMEFPVTAGTLLTVGTVFIV